MLFTNDRFREVSSEAKILYSILLERMDLSAKNGWIDEQGRVYIICTIEEIMEKLHCANQKATRLMTELEDKCGLIERRRQGLGKPNLIYVKNFISSVDNPVYNSSASHFKRCENHDSGSVIITSPDSRKSHGSNKDSNDTDMSYTENPIYPGKDADGMAERRSYESYFRDALEFEFLLQQYPYDRETLQEILDAVSRWQQKQAIKKEYAAAKAGKTAGESAGYAAGAGKAAGGASAKGAGKAAKETKNVMEKMAEFVSSHSHLILMLGGLLLVVMIVASAVGSCSAFFQSSTNVVIGTSYTAEDEDILGAEADYVAMETALQARLDNIRTEYDGYDEYNISMDEIGHNPYELASYLTILFESYTREQVQDTLAELFEGQYELTIDEVVETRTRIETREVEHTETNPETGEEDTWTETE